MPVGFSLGNRSKRREKERRDSIKKRVKLLRVLAFSGMLVKEDRISLNEILKHYRS